LNVRRVLRTATVAALAAAPTLAALPAYARSPENGEQYGPGLSILTVIGVYVGIPAGLFLLIAFLVVLPGLLHRPRYRPGRPWTHDPIWFAGPEDPEAALRAAVPALQAKGGVGADW
jgi:hypothetical protein